MGSLRQFKFFEPKNSLEYDLLLTMKIDDKSTLCWQLSFHIEIETKRVCSNLKSIISSLVSFDQNEVDFLHCNLCWMPWLV